MDSAPKVVTLKRTASDGYEQWIGCYISNNFGLSTLGTLSRINVAHTVDFPRKEFLQRISRNRI